jgi:predicted nucleic acid-binding protein
MTQLVVNQAMRLAFAYRLRAYDAVQLATALMSVNVGERARMFFVTADGNLETVPIAAAL